MRFLSIVICVTWLSIFVPSSVYAQNTVPEDDKGPSHLQQNKPPQEQPNSLPAEKMNEPGSISTRQGETDGDDPRPRTHDDVIGEILSGYSPDKHRPVLPRKHDDESHGIVCYYFATELSGKRYYSIEFGKRL